MSGTAVYITGAGIISAIGNSLAQTSRSLSDGISGIGKPEILKTSHTGLPCGEVKLSNEQLCKDLDIREGVGYNRTALLGIHAVRQAIRQAALTERQTGKALLFSGTTVGGMDSTEKHFLEMADEGKHLNLLSTHDSGSTTELISGYFGILPENTVTISTACSSAANAIIAGAEMIKARKADIVIAGGSEALSRFHLNGFNSLMILDNEPCRPFDKTRKGLNLGEGAAFIVMESEESLIKRNARPLAILAGYGNRCDAFHQTASSENGDGAVLAMEEAIEMAGIKPADIDYINAHGTGTPNNDESESRALQRVFGEKIPPVSSTKSFTGHTTSAAGAIETVISLIALTEGIIPANLGWKVQMEGGITPTSGVKGALLHNVMCNSFGFGGNDSSLILS
ncbi:MAG: beta-ketoacyl-[acyl-carrier-protein] synthase family protein, partial [Bacteroidetes bacterium]|nr:beta-ketoacyl-[acyl-carrier-protein] synthase family protein [Candidatus Egerieousia excrementavium]